MPHRFFALRLHLRIVLSLVMLFAVVMGVMGVVLVRDADHRLENFQFSHASLTVRTLAESLLDPMLAADYTLMEHLVVAAKSSADLAYAAVLDTDRRFVIHTDFEHTGDTFSLPDAPQRDATYQSRPIREIFYPIRAGRRPYGHALVAYYLDTKPEIGAQAQFLIGGILAAGLMGIVFGSIAVTNRMVKPITRLTELIRQSDETAPILFDHNAFPRDSEVGVLANALTNLSHRLLDQLEEVKRQMRERDQFQAEDRAKGEFIAHLSHELRTPLNAIMGNAYFLRNRHDLSEDARKQLATINQAAEHLLRLINEILELSRLSAGKVELKPEPCCVANVVNEVVDLARASAPGKRLDVRSEILIPNSDCVLADKVKLHQLLLNFTANAVKFTDVGTVCVRVARNDKNELVFSISDTGPGMSEEELNRVFDAYAQGSAGRRHGGTGLGMVIAQRFVTAMNGTIAISSAIGQGTVVTVTLPLTMATTAAPCGAPPQPITKKRFDGLRAVVVDDVDNNVELLAHMLQDHGFTVLRYADAANALSELERRSVDIVLTDIHMPGLDGFALKERLRMRDATRTTPIVAVTASVTTLESIHDQGFDEVIAKPVRPGALAECLSRLLHTPSSTNELRSATPTQDAFRAAIENRDHSALTSLIADLRQSNPSLASEMVLHLRRFDYDRISELISNISKSQG